MCLPRKRVNSDSNDARTLTEPQAVVGGQYNNTVENCTEACKSSGYSLAGVEFAQECCTCSLFDGLPSPDQKSLLKGVVIV